MPARHGELWRCACGEAVKGERCPACGKGFFEIDLPALTEAKDKRLAAEKAAREKAAAAAAEKARLEAEKAARLAKEKAERAAALAREKAERAEKAKVRRKKAGKILALAAAALAVAAAILLGIPGLSAMQAKKAADAGDYIGAVEKYRSAAGWGIFNALFHPGDKAEALVPAARYQEGEEALAEERYLDAVAAFEAAGDYEGAAERRAACLPGAIEAYAAGGELDPAAALLAEVPAGGEQERLALLLGEKAAEQGEYRRAYELYLLSGQKPEDKELWSACCSAALREYVAEGDMEAAVAAKRALPGGSRTGEAAELNLLLAEGFLQAEDYTKAKIYVPGSTFQDSELEARRLEARYQIGLGLYGQGAYWDARSYLRDNYKDSEHYYALCLLGEMQEKLDKGNYSAAVALAKSLDDSKLTQEEREAFHDALYSAGATASSAGYYADAFALFQFSGKGDYQGRMERCNQKYITTPREIKSTYSYHEGKVEITGLSAVCRGGTVTFTATCSVRTSAVWNFYPRKNGANSSSSYKRGTLNSGAGGFSFDVPLSMLTDAKTYETFYIALYGSYGDDYAYFWFDPLPEEWALDLYGNPIP